MNTKNYLRIWSPVLAAGLGIATPSAQAQQVTTSAAFGSDIWVGSMPSELFQLHENGGDRACSGTEKFVTVRGNLGFCIDANENAAGSLEWEDAREVCLAAGKRLLEPSEYKFACQAGISGLNNMTDDAEWASNIATFKIRDSGTASHWIQVPTMGNGGCANANSGFVANNITTSSSLPFRCMR